MALIENNLSNRLAHFDSETGNPVNEPYWSGLFKNLRDRIWSDIGNPKSEVSRQYYWLIVVLDAALWCGFVYTIIAR